MAVWLSFRRVAVAAAIFVASAQQLSAQPPNGPPGPWTVRSVQHVDLWFHGLATLGLYGNGPLPLYDRDYPARARLAKQAASVYPTRLDRQAPRLAAALRQDPAFELLHFMPLYFVDRDRVAMFDALRSVTNGRADRQGADPRMTAIATAFPLPAQRQMLATLLDALESEWRDFYAASAAASAADRLRAADALAASWNEQLASSLAPYLRSRSLTTGTILVSPVLAAEGRVMTMGSDRVLVAVRAPRSAEAADRDASAFLVLRELCYPVARAVLDGSPKFATTEAAERESVALATRCGALVLDRFAPSLRPAYEARLLETVAPLPDAATFTTMFPLDARTERQLTRALAVP